MAEMAEMAEGFDIVADVLVPLFQALFKAQNEYGWGSNSCAPGSISFVVAVLEGRLNLEARKPLDPIPQQDRLQHSPGRLSDYREALEKTFAEPTPPNLEALRREATQHLRRGGQAPAEALEEILSVITDEPDAYGYAMNELRGVFFSQLTKDYDESLANEFYREMDRQRRAGSHRPSDLQYREPEYVSDGMYVLLDDLYGVADVFARSFLFVVEDIPSVFSNAIEDQA